MVSAMEIKSTFLNILPIVLDYSFARSVQSGKKGEKGGFSGSAGAYDGIKSARLKSGGYLVQHRDVFLCSVIWIVTLLCVSLVSRFLLKKALEPTERVMQSQKEFVASASHELKAPLAVIVANVENMQHEAQNEGLQGNLKVIDSECMRMSRLIKDMLLLASSDAEKWTIHTSEVNVDTLLISLYEAYEPRCMKKKIKLTLDLGEELFPVIMTDKERLFQLLSIYLDNALHYSPEGKEIQIRVDMSSKELTFWIVDHGIGVEEKAKPFIFDRFYCADQSHTDKSHFGLGLSIAKELARMLQGKIGMEDTPGGGASFFFTLDLK